MEHKLIATHQLVDSATGTVFMWTAKEPLFLYVYRGTPENDTGVKPKHVLPLTTDSINPVSHLISPNVMATVAEAYLNGELIR